MKLLSTTAIAFLFLLLFTEINAAGIIQSSEIIDSEIKSARINNRLNTISYFEMKDGIDINEASAAQWINSRLGGDNYSWHLLKVNKDDIGFSHYRFIEFYNEVKIEDGVFYLHFKNGKLQSGNGELYNFPVIGVQEVITYEDALSAAKKYFSSNNLRQTNSDCGLCYFFKKDRLILSYKIDLYSKAPLKRSYIYVSATDGSIVFEADRIHDIDAPGTAVTMYNGTQNITTNSTSPSVFTLDESARPIATLNMEQNTDIAYAVEFTNTSNTWNSDDAAYDVHYGSEKTYDYYYSVHGRNSFDDSGSFIVSCVHFDYEFSNAFWDGEAMCYGDGDYIEFAPLTSTDIVGHEITHAVTAYTAGLEYYSESGALDEGFSDVFGITIDFYANPSKANWEEGEEPALMGTYIRNLADPQSENNLDTYYGLYWDDVDEEPHTNGSVLGYWYYLISEGGSGVNDLGNCYAVNGIGIHKAEKIAYRTLAYYLTPTAFYGEARDYSIQAAVDLYGSNSVEVNDVINAWYAVGIGDATNNYQINESGNSLMATGTGTIEWFNCTTQTIVPGQTANTFIPGNNNSYSAIFTNQQCTYTTECIQITGTPGFSSSKIFSSYPNPNDGISMLKGDFSNGFYLEVMDLTGRKLLNKNIQHNTGTEIINIRNYPDGLYFIVLKNKSGEIVFKEKLVKD